MTSANPIYDFFNTSGKEGMDLINYANGRMGLTGIAVGILFVAIKFFDKRKNNALRNML